MEAATGSFARVIALLATTSLLWMEASCFSSSSFSLNKAFATFYGGSDASGTMGKLTS
jgi:hypothetical protein